MADTAISALSAAAALTGAEQVPIVQSGSTVRTTAAAIAQSAGLGTLGYAERTADHTGITTMTDLTSGSVTVTVGAGRRVKITGQSKFTTTTATNPVGFFIREGSTQLTGGYFVCAAGVSLAHLEVVLTPSTGSHTYKLSADRWGSDTVVSQASSTAPAFILIEDIGT